jgi:hypothetical protein
MSDTGFEDTQCQYLWWLALRFVMWPHLVAISSQGKSQASNGQESSEASQNDEASPDCSGDAS